MMGLVIAVWPTGLTLRFLLDIILCIHTALYTIHEYSNIKSYKVDISKCSKNTNQFPKLKIEE